MNYTRLDAPIVYSGLGTPQEHACIVIQHQQERYQYDATDNITRKDDAVGEIVFIGKAAEAGQRYPEASVRVLENMALCPALVNAHTHVDLSTLPFQVSSYSDFVTRVVAHTRTGQRNLAAAQQGIKHIQASGVHVIGDIVTDDATMYWLLQHEHLQGVAYWEVLSLDPAEADAVFADVVTKIRHFKALERPNGVTVGITPHTPHTVSAPLLQKLAAFAKYERLPLQIHVAESPEEIALHQGKGRLLEQLRPFLPAHWQPSGTTPLRYLQQLGILQAQPTLVHMVHVDEEEVKMVQKAGATVVHCPRSNTALGCGVFPWQLYQRHAVEIALGTDSSASASSLSIHDEFQAARKMHPTLNPTALVRALVKGGHRALAIKPPQLVRGTSAKEVSYIALS